jgi:hypothetical protein
MENNNGAGSALPPAHATRARAKRNAAAANDDQNQRETSNNGPSQPQPPPPTAPSNGTTEKDNRGKKRKSADADNDGEEAAGTTKKPGKRQKPPSKKKKEESEATTKIKTENKGRPNRSLRYLCPNCDSGAYDARGVRKHHNRVHRDLPQMVEKDQENFRSVALVDWINDRVKGYPPTPAARKEYGDLIENDNAAVSSNTAQPEPSAAAQPGTNIDAEETTAPTDGAGTQPGNVQEQPVIVVDNDEEPEVPRGKRTKPPIKPKPSTDRTTKRERKPRGTKPLKDPKDTAPTEAEPTPGQINDEHWRKVHDEATSIVANAYRPDPPPDSDIPRNPAEVRARLATALRIVKANEEDRDLRREARRHRRANRQLRVEVAVIRLQAARDQLRRLEFENQTQAYRNIALDAGAVSLPDADFHKDVMLRGFTPEEAERRRLQEKVLWDKIHDAEIALMEARSKIRAEVRAEQQQQEQQQEPQQQQQ